MTRSRADRFAISVQPNQLHGFGNERGAWYESPEEIEEGLSWGQQKAMLLARITAELDTCLTPRERQCFELYYMRGLTFRDAADIVGIDASSVCRAVRRAVRKLRAALDID